MVEKPLARSRLGNSSAPDTSQHSAGRLSKYFTKLPTLLIGLTFAGLFWWLINNIAPDQVANIGFAGSYLPAVVLLFLASFFAASYLMLHTRRGFWLAYFLSWLFLTTLNQAGPSWWWLLVLVIFVILEYLLSLIDSYVKTSQDN